VKAPDRNSPFPFRFQEFNQIHGFIYIEWIEHIDPGIDDFVDYLIEIAMAVKMHPGAVTMSKVAKSSVPWLDEFFITLGTYEEIVRGTEVITQSECNQLLFSELIGGGNVPFADCIHKPLGASGVKHDRHQKFLIVETEIVGPAEKAVQDSRQ